MTRSVAPPPVSTANAIEIRGLQKHFPSFTLGPLDLTVPAGCIYGLIGPNGAGKTTTIDLLLGVGAKDAGSIRIHGFDHRQDDLEMKRRVGYVSPVMLYFHWKRIGRAIEFVRGFRPTWDQGYCDRLLRTFGLSTDDRIMTLSFGARMKFGLVLALSWRPPVLILDEPTTGLDPIARREMFAELLQAVQDETRSVLISTHAVADVERIADRVGMLRRGQIVFEGATAQVADRFRLVDFTLEVPAWTPMPGIVVQRSDAQRWRVVVDGDQSSTDELRALGARDVTESPMSLEDLFIAVGKA